MFFRFGAALSLVVLIALSGTAIEKQSLQLKRALSHQQYRADALLDSHVRLRLEAQRLGTPARLLGPLERGELPLHRPTKPQRTDQRRAPLLNWSPRSGATD
jgi:hypothetical protein